MRRPALILSAAALVVASCGTRGSDWRGSASALGPVVAAGRLVMLEANTSVLTALDPAGGAPLHVGVVAHPRALEPTPEGVLVIGGRGDHPGLDIVKLPAGERSRLTMPGAYDRVAVSPDGRYAVLFYDPTREPAPGGPAARNNNEIAVVDLKNAEVAALALRSESLAPQSVVFSPDGFVAAVVLDAAVAFVELSNPAVHVHVPLKLPGGEVLSPKKALFSPGGDHLFVHAAGSDDVLALEVVRGVSELGSGINFLFFPGASGLNDILVPQGTGFERSVVALYSGTSGTYVVLLDATGDTVLTRSVRLTRPLTSLADLGDGLVLGWNDSPSAERSRAVAGWAPLTGRMDENLLQGPVKTEPRFSSGAAFFPHGVVSAAGGARAALSGVTLEDDGARLRVRLSPVVLGGSPTAAALDADSGTLLLGVSLKREGSGAAADDDDWLTGSVVALKANSLAITGLTLDAQVERIGVVGSYFFALHPSPLGDVTFTPLDRLERGASRRVSGFFAGRLTDREDL